MENEKSGFQTICEADPWELVDAGHLNKEVGIQELRTAIPNYCFKPSLFWSIYYVLRDLTYSVVLLAAFHKLLPVIQESNSVYYSVVNVYAFCQGIVWTGLWVIAHDCGHSAFSNSGLLNDLVGFVLHSALLAPYFSWKSTHRKHHLYANHIEKDNNAVPPQRKEYAKKIGVAVETLGEVGQDAPIVLFIRVLLQQIIGFNWYILSNATCPSTAIIKQNMSVWRNSHFDPWGALFRTSEAWAVLLSDIGCVTTIMALYKLYHQFGSFETLFWVYLLPWMWVNHWVVMITILHHTHPSIPKYTSDSWTFLRGATATIDRDFSFIGTHFFHNISSEHVTHHLFSRIPHYYSPIASKAIVPLLGRHYLGRGGFGYRDLRLVKGDCQWVEGDREKDVAFGLATGEKVERKSEALWYRKRGGPPPRTFQGEAFLGEEGGGRGEGK